MLVFWNMTPETSMFDIMEMIGLKNCTKQFKSSSEKPLT